LFRRSLALNSTSSLITLTLYTFSYFFTLSLYIPTPSYSFYSSLSQKETSKTNLQTEKKYFGRDIESEVSNYLFYHFIDPTA